MVRYKVFLGAPRANALQDHLSETRSWQSAIVDSVDNSSVDLYANTIFDGHNSSMNESQSWDLPSGSLPGLCIWLVLVSTHIDCLAFYIRPITVYIGGFL